MLIHSLAEVLEKSGCVQTFWEKLDSGSDATLSVAASARPFLLAARFAHRPQPTLVVIAGEEAAQSFARNLASYVGEERVLTFPEHNESPSTTKRASASHIAKRMEAAHALVTNKPVLVVASARSLLRKIPFPHEKVCVPLSFIAQQELNNMPGAQDVGLNTFEDVTHALEARGYENTGKLEGPGTFAVHGGTIDIFPGNLHFPVRLDFFGDELEEIRRIVPRTGQTIVPLNEVDIYPVLEYLQTPETVARARKKLARPAQANAFLRELLDGLEGGARFEGSDALLPYLYNKLTTLGAYAHKNTLTTLLEPRSLFDDATHATDEIAARMKGSNIAMNSLFAQGTELNFGEGQRVTYLSIMQVGNDIDGQLPVKRVDVAKNPDSLYPKMKGLIDTGFTVVFSAANNRARADIKLAFLDNGLSFQEVFDDGDKNLGNADGSSENVSHTRDAASRDLQENLGNVNASSAKLVTGKKPAKLLRRNVINLTSTNIPLGMIIPSAKLALISLADTQGNRTLMRTRKHVDITEITFGYKPGDYVVHAAHGIAFFKELVCREIDGMARDYLLLEYAAGDKLYVPVEQLDRVTRYVGPQGASPRLTRLNTSDWSRALGKVRKATRKLAFDLVDVYARRASAVGYAFSPDNFAQLEMEQSFPYEETPDQLAAIADVKADMQSAKPMDRLICGDVGFGKTEVALRAAFKAVQDSKQVMVLCPTTILAQQHYIHFSERFAPFNVRTEVLSRFRTPAQQRCALEGFANGSVSVLIGTHRLLSRDVNPKDLGLIIVDEEQRFGVGHKEQLKDLREAVDVLTLSATPIPRTMQMSLSGVRDMSLILTPPPNRHAVEVNVGEFDPDVISAAIRRELARKGQVYYVSNRVNSIEQTVARVQEAVGEARIGVAHGQMGKDELERVMENFSAGELDVLVATTIIESGIDNPHTNTLIIEDAQRLGLAQMYQLKGRVGRSAVQAYAYFMFPENITLTEEASARLCAINEHQSLGSGIRIAMRDLEIRGAGSLLGAEQSGNLSEVGFDLFAQMLSSAIDAARTRQETSARATGSGASHAAGSGGARDRKSASGSDGKSALYAEMPEALSDIHINLPGHAYLPEEYIRDVDERVLWYRKIATAATQDLLESLREDLKDKHPDMPDAAKNLLAKAQLKAFAYEHGIKTIVASAGKLIIESILAPREKMIELKRLGGRYTSDNRKLSIPLHYFKLEENRKDSRRTKEHMQECTKDAESTMSKKGTESARGKKDAKLKKDEQDQKNIEINLFSCVYKFLEDLLAC